MSAVVVQHQFCSMQHLQLGRCSKGGWGKGSCSRG